MTDWQLQTPVVLLIFNRPDTTERVFETIRQAKPPKLLVVADGPRADKPGEAEKCAAARAIIDRVDWDCQVIQNYAQTNLGCRERVSSGLNWVFETVEEAIILEDDCLPHPTFFRFCEELLERYRHDDRIMTISGNNLQFGRYHTEDSYYFSRYTHIWGWASWRRAWLSYDLTMKSWSELRNTNWLAEKMKSERSANYWKQIFDLAHQGYNTWDYALLFACWHQDKLVALPKVNLVSNIGFREDATHTVKENKLANIPRMAIEFPLQHPQSVIGHTDADNFTEMIFYSGETYEKHQETQKNSQNKQNIKSNIEKPAAIMNSQLLFSQILLLNYKLDRLKESIGRVEKRQLEDKNISDIKDVEFQVYSQWGEDGIIQFLINNIDIKQKIFVEFGVENYTESNTRFLLVNNNWAGLVIDGSPQNIQYIKNDSIYWRHNLKAVCQFITKDNINQIIAGNGIKGEIGLLSIDIDGNDYWVWDSIHVVQPAIVIVEYNFRFGPSKAVTIPYQEDFVRSQAHHSRIYFGASLKALCRLANKKGYAFVGCNSAGNNAFFVRRDLKPDSLPELTAEQGYVAGQYRESRNEQGQLNYLSSVEEQKILKDLPVVEVGDENIHSSGTLVKFGDSANDRNFKFLFDAVFFQLYQTGIARLWRSLLEEWATEDFSRQIFVLDRDRTAPQIPGIQYIDAPRYDYNNTEADRQMLQEICDRHQIDVFVSSYYTTPITTPSVFMAYDMIPEIAGYDPNNPMWREKKYGLKHGTAYIAISESTARDLTRFFPQISQDSITVAHCGVNPIFSPASSEKIERFKSQHNISKPYFMLVGMRVGYKNAGLFFQAFSKLENKADFEVVCTGGGNQLEAEFKSSVGDTQVHMLQLSDEDLSAAYSGATALAFPSQYEGFGLPVLEAMACGCPVITCRKSSIPEVGGDAVIYIGERDVEGMLKALREVQKPEIRNAFVSAGLDRAKQFSWSKMTRRVEEALVKTALQSNSLSQKFIEISAPSSELLVTQIQQYLANPSQAATIQALCQSRQQLAEYWLGLSAEKLEAAYPGAIGKVHRQLWNSGLKNVSLTESDRKLTAQIAATVARGFDAPEAIQALVAATLYFYPHQLEIKYQRAPIPNWFAQDYLAFMFESPRLFKEVGEVDGYYHYLTQWLTYLYNNIKNNPDNPVWNSVTSTYVNSANLTPLYFSANPSPEITLKQIETDRADIVERYLQQNGYQLDYTFSDRPTQRRKIRFGILCQNFYPSAETFTGLPIFEHLDRTRFEVYLYSLATVDAAAEQFVRDRTDKCIDLAGNELNRAVETIRADDLDILFIGSNITARSYPITLLSLHRLARVQTVSLAQPVTTGMRNIDYYIAGTLSIPAANPQSYYREKLVTVEGSGLCFRFGSERPATIDPARASWGATPQTTIFISGANCRKLNPEVRHTWAKILAATPNSILVLYPFGPNWGRHPQLEKPFYDGMQAVFARYGIDAKRLVLIRTLPNPADIRKCLELADVYLDSYPYSGAASALDPLRVNLPLVVMEGGELRCRQSTSLLRELQIPDLIARNEEEYVRLAVSLGTNPQLRQQKRQQIQQQMQQSPPFLDSRGYGQKMGTLFESLFEAMVRGTVESGIASPVSSYDSIKHAVDAIEGFLIPGQEKYLFDKVKSLPEDATIACGQKPAIAPTQPSSEVSPPDLNRLLGCINLYEIDPSNPSIASELSQLRRQLAEYFLSLPTAELETVYKGELGNIYQTFLKSGFQTQPIPETDRPFVEQLTQQGAGFVHPQALNAFLGVMLYYAPGTMKVQDARDRLPGWLIQDYEAVFERQARVKDT